MRKQQSLLEGKVWILGVILVIFAAAVFAAEPTKIALILSAPYRRVRCTEGLDRERWPHRIWLRSSLVVHGYRSSPDVPIVAVFDSSGKKTQEGRVWFDNAARVGVRAAILDSNNALVVSGGSFSKDGALADFIAKLDRQGSVVEAIQTNPFLAYHLCSTGDDTIWGFGMERGLDRETKPFPMLRQFSLSKGELHSTLSRDLFKEPHLGMEDANVVMQCNSKMISLYVASSDIWIEVDPATLKLTSWHVRKLPMGALITGIALTETQGAFASIIGHKTSQGVGGLFALRKNEDQAEWVLVEGTGGVIRENPNTVTGVLGSENDDLVYLTAERMPNDQLYWSHVRRPGVSNAK